MQAANRRSIFLPLTDNHMIGILTLKSGKTRTSWTTLQIDTSILGKWETYGTCQPVDCYENLGTSAAIL
jgi:hypothetical protein